MPTFRGVSTYFRLSCSPNRRLPYKDGERKDCDILLYRIRQVGAIDTEGLFAALSLIGFEGIAGFGWVFKAKYKGKSVDLFFPEEVGGEYVPSETSEA